MTRKDSQLIAKVIRQRADNTTNAGAIQELENITIDFAKVLSEDNPKFNAEKFLNAAGF